MIDRGMIFRTAAISALLLGLISTSATRSYADDYIPLTDSETRALIVGKKVSFSGGGTATYNVDGTYKHTMSQIGARYSISGGKVCVDFDNDWRRCDRYVKKGNQYYLVNGNGRRFRAKIR